MTFRLSPTSSATKAGYERMLGFDPPSGDDATMSAYAQEPDMRAACDRVLTTACGSAGPDPVGGTLLLELGWIEAGEFHHFVPGNAPQWTVDEGEALVIRWLSRAADNRVRPGAALEQLGV